MVGLEDDAAAEDVEEAAIVVALVDPAVTLVGAEALEVCADEPQAAVNRAIPTASETPVVFLIRSTFRTLSLRWLGDDVFLHGYIRPGVHNGLNQGDEGTGR